MATPHQISANQSNAQSSTGPTTEAGKKRSSLNATRHGLTGQTLILSAEETEAYENHCLAYLEKFAPASHEEADLTQQYTDLTWSLHQISVQQANLMTVIHAITSKLMAAGEFESIVAATAPHYKFLSTLSIYETRRRRASVAVLEQLTALIEARQEALAQAAQHCKAHKALGKPWNPAEFGFVCSQADIDTFLRREELLLKRDRKATGPSLS